MRLGRLGATVIGLAFTTPAMAASSLCADPSTTDTVTEIVQNNVPSWAVDLAAEFGEWAEIERVKHLTRVTGVSSIRTIQRDPETKLSTCVGKVTFSLDDRTMAPEIRYTVQPLEDKPDQIHVEVISPFKGVDYVPPSSAPSRSIAAPIAPVSTPQASPAPPGNTMIVVNNPPAALPAAPATPTPPLAGSPMFDKGLADRTAWESWYNGLTEGDYKLGALYWAGERSKPHPGTCQGSPDFAAGCFAAKQRLIPTDILRKNEPFYRIGWNAYGH